MADSQKVALITGITGQDGSFLAEFLLDKGYEVHGIIRRSSSFNTGRIEHLYFDEWVRDMKRKRLINLHYGDMTDSRRVSIRQVLRNFSVRYRRFRNAKRLRSIRAARMPVPKSMVSGLRKTTVKATACML